MTRIQPCSFQTVRVQRRFCFLFFVFFLFLPPFLDPVAEFSEVHEEAQYTTKTTQGQKDLDHIRRAQAKENEKINKLNTEREPSIRKRIGLRISQKCLVKEQS